MKKLLFVLLAVLPLCSFGIEPITIELSNQTQSYTVPTNKVLLIENLAITQKDEPDFPVHFSYFSLSINWNGTSRLLRFNPDTGAPLGTLFLTLPKPLKLRAGAVVSIEINNSQVSSWDSQSACLCVIGILIDPADLYASIETQSDEMLCRNGTFSYAVLAASPRPGKIKLQGSTDLEEWHPIVDATIAKIDPSSHSVSVPIADNEKYYVKTLLTSVTQ